MWLPVLPLRLQRRVHQRFDADGICDEFETPGCTDPNACNYISGATQDDGSCEFDCLGCTVENACNFDADALIDDGSCEYVSCLPWLH